MRILTRDGAVFQGTAVQIVHAMQGTAFGLEDFAVPQYVAWETANARGLEKVDSAVGGATDGEIRWRRALAMATLSCCEVMSASSGAKSATSRAVLPHRFSPGRRKRGPEHVLAT